MIQEMSMLDVADNTGAKRVMCVKVLGGSKRRYASVGDVIVCVVKKALPAGEVKEHEIVVKVDESTNTRLRFTRGAIHSVLPDGKPTEEK